MSRSKRYATIKSGNKYGKWVVIGGTTKNKRGEAQFLCKCECGHETPVLAFNLIEGNSTKCLNCVSKSIYEVLGELIICEQDKLPTGCWVWPHKNRFGYGTVYYHKRTRIVHKLVYEHFCGPVPNGKQLDHLCGNRACSNFEHLDPVTPRENTLRGDTLAARNAAKTHCPKGHPYSGDNLFINSNGDRICRICHRERTRKSRLKSKLALVTSNEENQ